MRPEPPKSRRHATAPTHTLARLRRCGRRGRPARRAGLQAKRQPAREQGRCARQGRRRRVQSPRTSGRPRGRPYEARLVRYYASVGEQIALDAGRPLSLVRAPRACPGTVFSEARGRRLSRRIIRVPRWKRRGGHRDGGRLDRRRALARTVGTLELHVWGARIETLECPDQMVFDLDPAGGLPFARVVSAARIVRDLLEGLWAGRVRQDERRQGPACAGADQADWSVGTRSRSSHARSPRPIGAPIPSISRRSCRCESAPARRSSTICATAAARRSSRRIRPAAGPGRR